MKVKFHNSEDMEMYANFPFELGRVFYWHFFSFIHRFKKTDIFIWLYHKIYGHKLVAENLKEIDSNSYPYCCICGARPKEKFNLWWYYGKHLKKLKNENNL